MNGAVTLTCIVRIHLGMSWCSIGARSPSMPALCNSASSRPNSCSSAVASFSYSSGPAFSKSSGTIDGRGLLRGDDVS